jgi:hypothetical protein
VAAARAARPADRGVPGRHPALVGLRRPAVGAIIQFGDGLFGLEGWRVMFLLEGLPAVVLGVVCWFY